MTTFREALAPITGRLVREHDVLHVAANLPPGDTAVARARAEILRWAQKRAGIQLPNNAMAGEAFDLFAAGRSSSAVVVNLPQIEAWALRQEDPDKNVAGRIWTSEAIIWRTPDRPSRFAARLIVGTSEAELNISHATPGYVRQLAENAGLESGGRPLPFAPWYVGDGGAGQEDLIDLLVDPGRRLPIIVVSATDRQQPEITLDLEKLAGALCGLAHVAAVLPDTSWALTERFGKRLSVFDRAARIYMPGFGEGADPFAHPLWLGTRISEAEDAEAVDRQIRARVALFSTRAVRLGSDILPFAQLRSVSRRAEQESLAARGATDSEKLSAAENRIAALTNELAEAKDMERYAFEEADAAQRRAGEAESRERNATSRVQMLIQKAAELGIQPHTNPLPSTWHEFEDWTDSELTGRVVLASAARRGCKKSLYSDVAQAARCLLWLATDCRDRFLNGGGSLRDEPVDSEIRNSPCGSDEFTFTWQGHQITADWHIKNGGNTRDPTNCLRIYYAWDDQTQQIIVADMPAHRNSGAT